MSVKRDNRGHILGMEDARQSIKDELSDHPRPERKKHLKVRLRKLEQAISRARAGKKAVIITDHAIVRYMERVMGVDIEELAREIAPTEVRKAILSGPDGHYHHNDYTLRVLDRTVMTVTTDKP